MIEKDKDAVDTFLVDSIVFIAPTEANGVPCNIFSFEDGTQNFYSVATEEGRLAMSEHIQNSLTPTFIRFLNSYVNTLHLKSVEIVTPNGVNFKIVFLFKNGPSLTLTYSDIDLLREHHKIFHEEWKKILDATPVELQNPNPTRTLH